MNFTLEELNLIEECVQYRRMYYERIKYSEFASLEEKIAVKTDLKTFDGLRKTLREIITNEAKKRRKTDGK